VQSEMSQPHKQAPFISNTKRRWKSFAVKEPTVWKDSLSHSCTKDAQIKRNLTSHVACIWMRKKKWKKYLFFSSTYSLFSALFSLKGIFTSAAKTITCWGEGVFLPWTLRLIKYSPLLLNGRYQCSHFYPLQLAESSFLPFVHLLDLYHEQI